LPHLPQNHYTTLGLDHQCTAEQIRAAYRILAKQHHPDLNPNSVAAISNTQALNAAYAILSDPDQRRAYDEELSAAAKTSQRVRSTRADQNIAQEMQLRIEDFFRGTVLDVRVNDPGNPNGAELYQLNVPPHTAPGARFRIAREANPHGGVVSVRLKARPDFRLKIRGSDLRCDLRISTQRAAQGGVEMVAGPTGNRLRVTVPRGAARGEEVRIAGEGLPKQRGGRGDLIVRITYRPDVRITRR